MQMNPAPAAPIPIYGGGHSEPALARTARLCEGWLGGNAYTEDEARHYLERLRVHMAAEGREGEIGAGFPIYLAFAEKADLDLYRRFEDLGVTDVICAPWMIADMSEQRDYRSQLDAKIRATEDFATNVIARMG
jgi:alkanesulfonate monooxygenase SsuD/methylene tetrahydromethanopterin reductase-like flavin-dependent oxidoreductase (luciferase family)